MSCARPFSEPGTSQEGGNNWGKEGGNALFTEQLSPLREEKVLTGVINELLAYAQIFKAVTKQGSIHFSRAALDISPPAGLVLFPSAQSTAGSS